jgi:cell division protein FtsQ
LRARRVASHPAVESADVRAQLPDRVVVSVVEREPSIVWQTGERAVLVDEYGWVLAEGDAENLPRIIELSGQVPNPGERVSVEMVVAAHSLLQEFGSTMTLEYEEREGIAVHLPGDQVIVIGSPDELPVKLKVVSAVQDLEADWTLLDVRDPDRPYYQ